MDILDKFEVYTEERFNNEHNPLCYDVSFNSNTFSMLSPETILGNIPHPIENDLMCASVSCIWEGSKIFSDNHKPDYFMLFGKKPYWKNIDNIPKGYWIGDNNITTDVVEARQSIFIPAYLWVLEHRLKYQVDKLLWIGSNNRWKTIFLYDDCSNIDLSNPKRLSHSKILVDYLNRLYNDEAYLNKVILDYAFF